jgi:hypothetical protein
VKPSYAVAFFYVSCDTVDKGRLAFLQEEKQLNTKVITDAMDCLIWQTLASGKIFAEKIDFAEVPVLCKNTPQG